MVTGLVARLEELYLAYLLGRKQAALTHANSELADVAAALAIKRRLDATDAGTRERLRQWYAHINGRYQLPGPGGPDPQPGSGPE